jgi:hypothetical protein
MDALRNSKKISLLAVAILFLFTFFTLILDAPRTLTSTFPTHPPVRNPRYKKTNLNGLSRTRQQSGNEYFN